MSSFLNSYFDKIYCINLDRRPDRWQECEEIFAKQDLIVERISAVDGNPDPANIRMTATDNRVITPGTIGCAMSHLKVVQQAKSENLSKILILEDDIDFIENVNQKFEEYILFVPNSWQLLYTGGNHLGHHNVKTINQHCVRIFNTYTTHFIGMRSTLFDTMINRIPSHITNPIDVIYAEWQRQFESYCIVPHLSWQRTSFSDISNCLADYENIVRGKDFHIN